ncbi:MAG: Stk1 family PASTA domain-containing Ser/Thr kinase [Rhodoglobus sp.]
MIDGVAESVRELAGRYHIGKLLGHGGMADVYQGTDSRLGRRVAIKLLKPSLASDPGFRSRFRREAQDAAKMAHPTIVRIFDAGEETVDDADGTETLLPFIVMEYVDGKLLKDIIAEGVIAPTEAARIVTQVLTALEYSHRAGVVHRDIKPGNIMVTTGNQIKVMDFGIARAISDSSTTIAETSAIVGTASYFSPEQARGEAVDARTDLYSTGVLLFELLTGHPPFRGDNPVAVAYQHVNSDVVAPSTLNPKISPALDAVVLRSLSKDRFDRYQSADDFRQDVKTAVAGAVPVAKQLATKDFNNTLFGVNPSSTTGSEAAIRQLTVGPDDRFSRTQNRPPVAWIWAGIASMVVIIVAVVFWSFNLSPANLAPNLSTEVPNLVGQSFENGSSSLEKSKLNFERISETSSTVPENTIVRTDPEGGSSVPPETLIKIYVSSGRPTAAIPDVSGMSEADAVTALSARKLVYGVTKRDYSPDLADGFVIETDPKSGATSDSGERIREGDTINLIVSNGLINVPNVTGQSIKDATNALAALQVELKTRTNNECSGGMVSTQSVVGEQAQKTPISLLVCRD